MVLFQIMSDIHIESYDEENISLEKFIVPSAPYLILAGDIGRVLKYKQLKNFLEKLCREFQAVFYVLGNHEYYKVEGCEEKNIKEIFKDVKKMEKELGNLFILNRNKLIIDNVCIVGATLWSYSMIEIPSYIKIPNLNKKKYNDMFKKDFMYITKMINWCKKKKYKLLVVSHHCPIILNFKKDLYSSLYMTDLDFLLKKSNIHTWVCGHTHINFDFINKKGTRILANQKGKGGKLSLNYSKNKVIKL